MIKIPSNRPAAAASPDSGRSGDRRSRSGRGDGRAGKHDRQRRRTEQRDVPLTSTTVENCDEYDTVFIGYPLWWGIAAWPVNGFVVANDFSGKTVIPFCTSASSGLGQSGELLAALAGTGDWQEGLRGFTDCLPGAKVKKVIYGEGVYQKGEVNDTKAFKEAFETGKAL